MQTMKSFLSGIFFLLGVTTVFCGMEQSVPQQIDVSSGVREYGIIPGKFTRYDVILRPDKIAPEWWAGAPSVVVDKDGIFWMACRMRTAEAPRGLRGYEIRLLRSQDGIHFEKVQSILRENVPIAGVERPALLIDPRTGLFKLYICGPIEGDSWGILKLKDATKPGEFQPSSAKVVIRPPAPKYDRDIPPRSFKDPVLLFSEGTYHCFVIGYIRQNERIFHFQSKDGEDWQAAGNPYQPIMDLSGWHDFFVRPASILPLGVGYLFIYEGSGTSWHDPVYNIATGIGFSFDLHTIIDLTPEAPLLFSSTPSKNFRTLRYSSWLTVGEEFWVYAEVECPDETKEIRLFRIKR